VALARHADLDIHTVAVKLDRDIAMRVAELNLYGVAVLALDDLNAASPIL
jgi:hypothetical protein